MRGVVVAVLELALVNHHCHQLEVGCADDVGQRVQKGLARLLRQPRKRPLLAPNIRLVQHHHVVAEGGELQGPDDRRHRLRVLGLAEDAERQHEHRVVRVDGREAVVTALVHVNDVVAVAAADPRDDVAVYRIGHAVTSSGRCMPETSIWPDISLGSSRSRAFVSSLF